MKRRSMILGCAIAALLAFPMVDSAKIGTFGVDVVSAASGSTSTPKPAPKPSTSKPSTSKPSTSKPSTSSANGILKIGSRGMEVKSLQTRLNFNGYGLKVDGIYGKATFNAVKDYQSKKGLVADGIAGPKTLARINPASAPAPTTPAATLLKVGSKGSAVTTLQTTLNTKGYNLKVDGIFGKGTLAAVKDFQTKNGLKADGIVGPLTNAKLGGTTTPTTPEPTKPLPTDADVVTTATQTVINTMAAFEKGISPQGTWIIAALNDLTTTKELTLEGEFKNGKGAVQRKIALYTQDANKNITDSFTLTAPKLTIKSPNARIQGGTFKGDLYVSAANFELVNARVIGNVYFTTQEAKDTFKSTNSYSRTGILTEVDAVATASLVRTDSALETAIGANGKWIAGILNDITTKKDLVIDGTFTNTKTPPVQMRKVALYSQITLPDKTKQVTRNFTLTAPTLTVKSPDANLTNGIFKGDIYVTAPGFKLVGTQVVGNLYFATEELKAAYLANTASTGTVSGVVEVKTK